MQDLKCAAMSCSFRTGLGELASGREGIKLRPNELRLGYQICLETFDAGLESGRCTDEDLDRWARLLNLKDSKGFRGDKVASILNTLKDLGIVDINPGQGTFEPRPHPQVWLRARAMRAREFTGAVSSHAPELQLRAERPLSEALSELSREAATGQTSTGATPAVSSDKSDETQGSPSELRRINPTTQQSPDFAAKTASSEKSDDSGGTRARERLTCTRLEEVQKTFKRSASSEKSDEPDPRRRHRVQERVRSFVGLEDWARKGSWGSAYYVWNSGEAIDRVERVLNYVLAGLQDKSIKVEKTPGACLWYYYGKQTEKETGLKRWKFEREEARG